LLNDLSKNLDSRETEGRSLLRAFISTPATASTPSELDDIIPKRNAGVVGNLEVYYYDYLDDHLQGESPENLARLASLPNGGTLVYEALNLVDGKRSVREIRDILSAAYGAVAIDAVIDYLKLLEKIGVVTM